MLRSLLAWLILPAFVLANDAKWSTVKGKVVFDDSTAKVPVPGKVNTGAADLPACAAADKEFKTEEWIVDPKTKGVKNAIVWIGTAPTAAELARLKTKKADLPSFTGAQVRPTLAKAPAKTLDIDQPCCRFIPRVLVARAGDTLNVKNSADFPHNVFWSSSENGNFNQGIPSKGSVPIKDLKTEKYPILASCTIHPWMKFYIKVFDHPYFAVTNEAGEFEIKNAPVGKARIVVWHESVGLSATGNNFYGEEVEIKPATTETRVFKLAPLKD